MSASRIFAVVLAAGESRRFGSVKQLATVAGRSLVETAAATAVEACGDRSVLVVGHEARAVTAAAADTCRFLVVNEGFGDGMGSSIALASRVLEPVADALLIMLADQPLVTAAHLDALIGAWSGNPDEIVVTAYDSAAGPPTLLPAGTFNTLRKLSGDSGARGLLSDERFQVVYVPFAPAAVDIDTPDDLPAMR